MMMMISFVASSAILPAVQGPLIKITNTSGEASGDNGGMTPHQELYTTPGLNPILQIIIYNINRSSIAPILRDIMYFDPAGEDKTIMDPLQYCNDKLHEIFNGSIKTDAGGCSVSFTCDYQSNRFPAFLISGICLNSYCIHPQTFIPSYCALHRENIAYLVYYDTSKTSYNQYNENSFTARNGYWKRKTKTYITDCLCSY
jgi:hypothetical protein